MMLDDDVSVRISQLVEFNEDIKLIKNLKYLQGWAVIVNRIWGNKITYAEAGQSIKTVLGKYYDKNKETQICLIKQKL